MTPAEAQARRERHKHDGWIGCDLDGTLAFYERWEGPAVIGEPIPLMLERVKRFLADGYEVRILTARVSEDPDGIARRAIEQWTEKHLGQALGVTCIKDFAMIELYDDRAVQVIPNTGRCIAEEHYAEASARAGAP